MDESSHWLDVIQSVAIQSPATRAFLRCCAPDRGVASPEYFFKGLIKFRILASMSPIPMLLLITSMMLRALSLP